ncbi:choline trimethylamine-lyase [Enterococcus sp. BWR-S5]|uniref:choline trimethylamine-lyase n=1 Tax=Enterococcus sp. BWR-S5 TaxID=2787714 RepID=UPI001923A3E1|nr:choline trimethylamine-lyase [Enterococcus sp. BWR-S5]MBL1227433.1 choline trimethylamine-lyase [Enterococcus sp. BWR-S5]
MGTEQNDILARLRSLKERYLTVKPSISIGRALAYTEVFEKYGDLPRNILRAKGFRRACETAPMLIQDHELIIGHPCGKPRAGAFSPDTAWEWLAEELDTISTRPQDPYFISEEDKRIMRERLFPFWQGKSLAEECEKAIRSENEELWEFGAEACISDLTYHMTSGGGDTSPGYDIILFKKGINGIKSEAEEYLMNLMKKENKDEAKVAFYEAAIETCEGILTYAARLSAYASELAEKEQEPKRKAELEMISKVNANVPANPPESFQEALQAIWTIQSLFLMEENQCSTSLGRIDQYVYPCYDSDIRANKIDNAEALELMGCFILKCSEMIWYTPGTTAKYFAGYMPFINMTVGGLKREGGDGTNELTYLIMDAVEKVKVYQPSLACRIHNQSPAKYLDKIVDVIKAGVGMPACHFDDSHIKMMLSKGFDSKDARDYCLMGCVEPQKSGRIHQWTAGGFTQWPITIEMVLNRGALKSYGEKQWLDTGDLQAMTTYEKFEAAVKSQLNYLIDRNAEGTTIIQKIFRDITPTPYMSLFVDGCMKNGKDVTAGGAVLYEGPGTIFAGLGTYVDSMAAIKKLVYEEKKYTLMEMKEALDCNWQGHEQMLRDCQEAPKYGNDDDYVDYIAAEVVDYTEKRMNSHKSLYARQIHGTLSQSFNTPLGEMLGATPNGRFAFAPLSDAMSPSQGADTKGATAAIKSVSKINVASMSLGMAHNFKVTKNSLNTSEGKAGVITLLRTASLLGNGQMQFNCVDNATLLRAQRHPKEYRDLIVRVAGYSAFFGELCKEVQDEIISRTVVQ